MFEKSFCRPKNYFKLNQNHNRHKNFYGTAKKNDDDTWRIHVFADHYPNVDIESTNTPIDDMIRIHAGWVAYIQEMVQ